MTFIFRNRTIFWDISKWNRGQKKWDGGSNIVVVNWFGILFIFGYFEFVKIWRCAEFTNDIKLGLCSCLR